MEAGGDFAEHPKFSSDQFSYPQDHFHIGQDKISFTPEWICCHQPRCATSDEPWQKAQIPQKKLYGDRNMEVILPQQHRRCWRIVRERFEPTSGLTFAVLSLRLGMFNLRSITATITFDFSATGRCCSTFDSIPWIRLIVCAFWTHMCLKKRQRTI